MVHGDLFSEQCLMESSIHMTTYENQKVADIYYVRELEYDLIEIVVGKNLHFMIKISHFIFKNCILW